MIAASLSCPPSQASENEYWVRVGVVPISAISYIQSLCFAGS